jgi:hypothetical protein
VSVPATDTKLTADPTDPPSKQDGVVAKPITINALYVIGGGLAVLFLIVMIPRMFTQKRK